MAIYVVGDIQGCLDPLQQLLEKVNFDPARDALWTTGDLVNRGPSSLAVLRFFYSLKNSQIVLGNHDLHLLSVLEGQATLSPADTLDSILDAPDSDQLATWLRHQPLLYYHQSLKVVLVHAGLPPEWDLTHALQHAAEVERALQGPDYREFLAQMRGNLPNRWYETYQGWDRLRYITNALTRLRFCDAHGALGFDYKSTQAPPGYLPWFEVPGRRSAALKILFGHWASLEGKTNQKNVIALDTGCVWGHCLTALRLEDGVFFRVNCPAP
ncbi:symmetrical bis(5'-nucleosyl)-tetraphosphatase [Rickettsiella massiliensis]|uniref:symmetrical bis(5'-nucleosyl)-tetraphosphatase n=1 Tax=Rickettsiella massiliensis TaxID=676517 RepID=UPI00029A0487|nr:symmetrical bis(5'-nucleosyl)-tetraphosphatase [Rickettsiella massiliensis]